jgi:hypothetical protein
MNAIRRQSFMTVGIVSGRGNGRDQSGRDTALILHNSTKRLTEKVCIYGRESSPVRKPAVNRVLAYAGRNSHPA